MLNGMRQKTQNYATLLILSWAPFYQFNTIEAE